MSRPEYTNVNDSRHIDVAADVPRVAIQVSRAAEQVEKSVLRLKGIARRMSDITARDHGYDAFRV